IVDHHHPTDAYHRAKCQGEVLPGAQRLSQGRRANSFRGDQTKCSECNDIVRAALRSWTLVGREESCQSQRSLLKTGCMSSQSETGFTQRRKAANAQRLALLPNSI